MVLKMSANRIEELLKTNRKCQCGLSHSCGIDKVLIADDAIKKLPEMIFGYAYQNITLISDYNTYRACGESVEKLLVEHGIKVASIVLSCDGVLVPNEDAIEELINKTEGKTDLMIAVGSGVINDLCKFVSHKLGLPYFIVATAPSMDGYASAGAALIIDNMKVTYQTHTPQAIIADINVLKNAPIDMIKAGFGDMVGKYSALCDWKLGSIITKETYCELVAGIVEGSLDNCIKNVQAILGRENSGIKELMEGLVIVGIAMSFMDNSRPASGSEHHLSHFFEVIGIMDKKPCLLHGLDVFYSTAITSALRQRLAGFDPNEFNRAFDKNAWQNNIKSVYKAAAGGVIELQDRLQFYSEETRNRNYESITKNWDAIKAVLKEAPSEAEINALLDKAGLSLHDFYNEYGAEMIKNSILYSKDLKDRYTILCLLCDIGLLEDFANDLSLGER